MGREPNYFLKDSKKNEIAIYKTPFTKQDYNYIVTQEGAGEKFGIHDSQTKEVKFYDLGNGHVPTFNKLFNIGFDVDFFTSVKIIGLGVIGFWAFRLSRAVPSNPFKPNKKAKNFVKELLKNSSKPEPTIIYADGEGFKEAN